MMNSFSQQNASHLMVSGRLLIGAIFLLSGIHKITNPEGTQQYMASMGMPATGFFFGRSDHSGNRSGIIYAVGLRDAYWSRAAVSLFDSDHINLPYEFSSQTQVMRFMKYLSMMGGLVYVVLFGPGRFSIDRPQRATAGRINTQIEVYS